MKELKLKQSIIFSFLKYGIYFENVDVFYLSLRARIRRAVHVLDLQYIIRK